MSGKIKGPIDLNLDEGGFCQIWVKNKNECKFGISATSDSSFCTALYQDGRLSLVPPGKFYPFSHNPRKKGTRFKNRKISRAKIVVLSCSYILKIRWGTREKFWVRDKNGDMHDFGAHGVFFAQICDGTGGTDQNMFYRALLSQGDGNAFDVEAFRDYLKEAFQPRVSAEIQHLIEAMDCDLKNLKGLTPDQLLDVSKKAYDILKPYFKNSLGLTLHPYSENSIVGRLFNPNTFETYCEAPEVQPESSLRLI